MRTKTVYLPSIKNPNLEAEVTKNGEIVSCYVLVPAFCQWIDGMEDLKNHPGKIKAIQNEAATLDWNDHGDRGFEQWKEESVRMISEKLGVKLA